MVTDPYPEVVEPAPEPCFAELDGFELTVPRVEIPRIDVPTVDAPTGGGAETADGSSDALRDIAILYYVVLGHAVVVLISLGGLFVAGGGRWTIGGKLLAAGAILAVYTSYRYRHPPRLPP